MTLYAIKGWIGPEKRNRKSILDDGQKEGGKYTKIVLMVWKLIPATWGASSMKVDAEVRMLYPENLWPNIR